MNKKHASVESIRARGEKLFRRGNFELAKKEFEKLHKIDPLSDLSGKIEICKKETEKLKAKELLKRARKHNQRNNIKAALSCYQEAYQIQEEQWVAEKIAILKKRIASKTSMEAAQHAESAGDYERAAALYEDVCQSQKTDKFLINKAYCLVKAERYNDAIAVFKSTSLSDMKSKYYSGFALAQTANYYDCLKVWDTIVSTNREFIEQKANILSRLFEALYAMLGDSNPTRVYEQGRYLLEIAGFQGLSSLVENAKFACIEQLWVEEQYERIIEMLLPYPVAMEPDLLALYAKVYFKAAEVSAEYICDAITFWLTAVYCPQLSNKIVPPDVNINKVRAALIEMMEGLIKKYTLKEHESRDRIINHWELEKRAIDELHSLSGDIDDFSAVICTPHFAELFGNSLQVLDLIRKNKMKFSDIERYFEIGGYFSLGRKSLYQLENHEYQDALSHLPDSADNEFTAYCIQKVNYVCGMHYLEEGKDNIKRYFAAASPLFSTLPRYEKELIEKSSDAHDLNELNQYEAILNKLSRENSSQEIKNGLSLVMAKRTVLMFNKGSLNARGFENVLKNALKLNPHNELVLISLKEIKEFYDIEQLYSAFDKGNLRKASSVAAQSKSQKIKDEFFEYLEAEIDLLEKEDLDNGRKKIVLYELYQRGAAVDRSHPVLSDISEMLEVWESKEG